MSFYEKQIPSINLRTIPDITRGWFEGNWRVADITGGWFDPQETGEWPILPEEGLR